MVHESPPTSPFGVVVAPWCGLPSWLAFVAAHKLNLLYAMTLDRNKPISAKDADMYLVWNGVVQCRVPIHSIINTAYGWVIVLDAPKAIGVKTPAIASTPRTPEQAPWNAWAAGEKRGKEVGEEHPNPTWLSKVDRVELNRAVERMREVMTTPVRHVEYALPPLPFPRPIPPPLHSPPVLALVPPVPATMPGPPVEPAVAEEYELPFEVESDGPPSSGVRATPAPQPTPESTNPPQLPLW
jgi:hypothetical protein